MIRAPFSWNKAHVEVVGGDPLVDVRLVAFRRADGWRAVAVDFQGSIVRQLLALDTDASWAQRGRAHLVDAEGEVWIAKKIGDCGC
jgi:hypothetical protein